MLKLAFLDKFIIVLMFALLPVDMINGILLTKGVTLPISIGQVYKLLILLFLLFRFLFYPKHLLFSLALTLLLFVPSIYQLIKGIDYPIAFGDFIKISKYLTPLYSFMFFVGYIKKGEKKEMDFLLKFIKFSYLVLVGNIFLKHVGLGYPMYVYGNIGSKGYFYAGNEVSALLVIISSILAFTIWQKGNRKYYLLFTIITLFAGLTVSSKTGVAGLLIVFLLIPMKQPSLRVNVKKTFIYFTAILALVPLALYGMWRYIQNTDLMIRITHFSQKFDFLTFILSNRNVFFRRAYENYLEQYDPLEKIIGVGQTKYEFINKINLVEIDILDIWFAYGILGAIYFLLIMTFLIVQSTRFSKSGKFPFANFVLLMLLLLLAISSTAGHVYSSGMAAIFIGALFSLMYYNVENDFKSPSPIVSVDS